jgi:soluble lytic murein transglycosylase
LLRKADQDKEAGNAEAAALFIKALNSSNVFIRQAAAEQTAILLYEGAVIPKPALDRVRREAAGSWAAAFDALDALDAGAADTEKVLAFLLGGGTGEALRYTMEACQKRYPELFTDAENAVINGRITASRSRFGDALVFFRMALDGDPGLFFQYPGLLNDLGRCFQYAGTDNEGLELFLKWESELAVGKSPAPASADTLDIHFRLLFFAARIARQRRQTDQGMELFARALPFAPDSGQADACIWYILDSALSRGAARTMPYLETCIPQWHDNDYFFDVMDKLSRELVMRRQWKELIQVFSLLRGRSGDGLTAKYAWIIGRAIEAGRLSPEEVRLAEEAAVLSGNETPAKAYLRIAYETGTPAALYYRFQSARSLEETFLELPQSTVPKTGADQGRQQGGIEFLLGFFNNGAANFAPRYIRAMEQDLSAGELRLLAEVLAAAELYAESIRLVSVYTGRDYTSGAALPDRRDMELWYPRPFKALVEQYAGETGLDSALLYGLIRTESAFQSDIVSRAGAVGLTQLMPATAHEMAARIRRQGGPDYTAALELRDPAANIHIGAVYLAYLVDRMEDTLPALLAYNGGMSRVRRWRAADSRASGGALPMDLFLETVEFPETREYGRKVLAAAAVYRELYSCGGFNTPPFRAL